MEAVTDSEEEEEEEEEPQSEYDEIRDEWVKTEEFFELIAPLYEGLLGLASNLSGATIAPESIKNESEEMGSLYYYFELYRQFADIKYAKYRDLLRQIPRQQSQPGAWMDFGDTEEEKFFISLFLDFMEEMLNFANFREKDDEYVAKNKNKVNDNVEPTTLTIHEKTRKRFYKKWKNSFLNAFVNDPYNQNGTYFYRGLEKIDKEKPLARAFEKALLSYRAYDNGRLRGKTENNDNAKLDPPETLFVVKLYADVFSACLEFLHTRLGRKEAFALILLHTLEEEEEEAAVYQKVVLLDEMDQREIRLRRDSLEGISFFQNKSSHHQGLNIHFDGIIINEDDLQWVVSCSELVRMSSVAHICNVIKYISFTLFARRALQKKKRGDPPERDEIFVANELVHLYKVANALGAEGVLGVLLYFMYRVARTKSILRLSTTLVQKRKSTGDDEGVGDVVCSSDDINGSHCNLPLTRHYQHESLILQWFSQLDIPSKQLPEIDERIPKYITPFAFGRHVAIVMTPQEPNGVSNPPLSLSKLMKKRNTDSEDALKFEWLKVEQPLSQVFCNNNFIILSDNSGKLQIQRRDTESKEDKLYGKAKPIVVGRGGQAISGDVLNVWADKDKYFILTTRGLYSGGRCGRGKCSGDTTLGENNMLNYVDEVTLLDCQDILHVDIFDTGTFFHTRNGLFYCGAYLNPLEPSEDEDKYHKSSYSPIRVKNLPTGKKIRSGIAGKIEDNSDIYLLLVMTDGSLFEIYYNEKHEKRDKKKPWTYEQFKKNRIVTSYVRQKILTCLDCQKVRQVLTRGDGNFLAKSTLVLTEEEKIYEIMVDDDRQVLNEEKDVVLIKDFSLTSEHVVGMYNIHGSMNAVIWTKKGLYTYAYNKETKEFEFKFVQELSMVYDNIVQYSSKKARHSFQCCSAKECFGQARFSLNEETHYCSHTCYFSSKFV